MKILLTYLKPYKWHIALALLLAGINQTFSMFDPMIFGKFWHVTFIGGNSHGK